MKRLVICFDGTWNRLDAPHPTNVLFTAESVLPVASDGTVQVVYYDEGVGTNEGDSLTGGIFGAGLLRNLSDAYRFIIFNYAPGDEIHVFGFSRGAYTARSLAGLLATSGLVSRRHAGRANEAIAHYRLAAATRQPMSRRPLRTFAIRRTDTSSGNRARHDRPQLLLLLIYSLTVGTHASKPPSN